MSDQKSVIKIYGCGGCGINQVRNIDLVGGDIGLPEIEKVFVDTSTANIPEGSDIPFFHIPGMTGAGKKRLSAYHGSNDQHIELLKQYKPSQSLNIVIFSTSGGSGSVLGPLIAGELTNRGMPTICIVVGSIISKVEAHNTHATLETIEGIAVTNGKPILISYFQNTANDDYPAGSNLGVRNTVDEKISEAIRKMATLASEKHEELDREDIYNWIDYTRVFDIPAQLIDLIISSDGDRINSMKGHAITVANLFKSKSDPEPDLQQMYVTTGYYKKDLLDLTGGQIPNFSFITTHSLRQPRYDTLNSVAEEFNAAKERLTKDAASNIKPEGGGFKF